VTEAMHQILVIEDEPHIRHVLKVLLEAERYRVNEADTALRAEIEARSHKPDLLMVDLGLPDGDGLAIIRRVRAWSPVPIVVLSARTMEDQKDPRPQPWTCAAHANILPHMAKMIQLRHVPETLHRQLKARAAMAGLSLSDFLVREVRKIAELPTPEEMAARLRQREPYRGKLSPSQILREERDSG
jgi:CheY-like chemotaxis protein